MSIVLLGSTSGSVTLQEPAVSGSTVLSLPAVTGTVLTTTSPKAGNVLQVVSTSSNSQTSTASTSFVATNLTATITPTATSSKILILVSMPIYNAATSSLSERFTIYRGTTSGTNLGNSTTGFGVWNFSGYTTAAMSYLDSPSTTSAQQYTVAISSEGGTNTVYALTLNSFGTITLLEIAG